MSKKNRMTPLFIAAAIVAAPFVLWFLRRRARPRPDKEDAEAASAASFSGAHADTAPREVPRPPNSSVLVEEEEDVAVELGELPTAALQPSDAAQTLSESGTPTLQFEAAILDAAHPESSNSPLVETNEESAMPEEEQPVAHQAAAVAAGSQIDGETKQVHTAIVEVLPPDSALVVEAKEIPGTPEAEEPAEFPAATAGPQSEADTCEEHNGAGTKQNGPIVPSAQVSDDIPFLPSAGIFAGHEETAASGCPPGGQLDVRQIAVETEAALPPPDADGVSAGISTGTEKPDAGDTGEGRHLYRPPPQRPPRQTARPVTQSSARSTSDLALGIRVRLRFDRFDFCEIRFIPERLAEMDNEVEVKTGGTLLQLVAQEEWYEDLPLENIGDRLRRGLELKGLLADHRRAQWLLTGRDIYVLASHQRASGFVSTTRLVLGRSHVVLCVDELLQQVEVILNEAGCQGYTKLDEAHGVPAGWVGLRSVEPSRAVPLEPGIDPFYAIKPAPDIEIELDGGVCLRNSIWLAGFAPRIKLLGDTSGPVKVVIDGKEAIATGEGSFVVHGYDQPGQHFVYCDGLSCSRSYSIEEPPDAWEEWPAYQFGQAEICGPLVRLPEAEGRRIFSVPMSNPLLLGAEPGQIFRCSPRSVKSWKGFVPFDVVWALPAVPYICNKKTARILQFAQAPLALAQSPKRRVLPWCAAILEASRKGLQIENGSPEGMVLWKEYKQAARNIWRAAR